MHTVFSLDKEIQTDARRNVEIPEVMKLTGHFSHSIYMYSIGLTPEILLQVLQEDYKPLDLNKQFMLGYISQESVIHPLCSNRKCINPLSTTNSPSNPLPTTKCNTYTGTPTLHVRSQNHNLSTEMKSITKSASVEYLSSSHTNSMGPSYEYSCNKITGLSKWNSEDVIKRYTNIAVDVEFTDLLNPSGNICNISLSDTVEPTSNPDPPVDVVLVYPGENQNKGMGCVSECDRACVTSSVEPVTHPSTVTSVPDGFSNASMSSSVAGSVPTISNDKALTQVVSEQQNVSTETSDDSHFEIITDPAPVNERELQALRIDVNNCATLSQTKLSAVHKDHFIVETDTILVDGRGPHLTKDIMCRNGANHCGSTSSGGLSGRLVDYTGYIELEAPL